jgi:hypothetical protein
VSETKRARLSRVVRGSMQRTSSVPSLGAA